MPLTSIRCDRFFSETASACSEIRRMGTDDQSEIHQPPAVQDDDSSAQPKQLKAQLPQFSQLTAHRLTNEDPGAMRSAHSCTSNRIHGLEDRTANGSLGNE